MKLIELVRPCGFGALAVIHNIEDDGVVRVVSDGGAAYKGATDSGLVTDHSYTGDINLSFKARDDVMLLGDPSD